MKASTQWLEKSGARFSAGFGESGLAHLKDYSVEFRVWGQGPPLVLVPGLAGGYDLLGPLARFLAEHYRVISYQLRGEDDCFALRQHFDMEDLVDDLDQFLCWHGLERPAIMGVSFGAVLALEYAARYPHRLDSLVVQGVGARFEHGLLQQVAGTILSRFPLPTDSPFVNQFFNLLFGGRQKAGPLVEFVTQRIWQTDQSVMAHRFRLVENLDLESRLASIRARTLILAGDRDILVSGRSVEELNEAVRQSEVVRLRKAGHLAFVTHAERVAEEVHRFLKHDNATN